MFSLKHWPALVRLTVWLLLVSPSFVTGDTITSTVIADVGNDESEVEDSQTNTFLPLAAVSSHTKSGIVINSSVNASFTSEDIFQVNVNNDWDFRGFVSGETVGFGTHFEYEFVAEGTQLSVTTSNFIEQPLFSGASTFGANPFRWRILDLTLANGFVVIDVDTNGTQSLPLTMGHDYLLRLADNSSVSGASPDLGLLHSATFDVAVPALFASGDFNGDFNNNGTVDAADYTVWRDNLNGGTPLPNDNGLGTPIGTAHYDLWVDNFGSAASTSNAVPEPNSLLLSIMAILAWVSFHKA